jgi:hypothetical protein
MAGIAGGNLAVQPRGFVRVPGLMMPKGPGEGGLASAQFLFRPAFLAVHVSACLVQHPQ